MNVCAVSTSTYAGGDCGSNGGWFCQFDQGRTTLVATTASVSAPPLPSWNKLDDGVMLIASNGDKCFYQGQEIDSNLQVTFNCASKTGSTFTIYEDADDSKCLFHAAIDSTEACAGPPTPPLPNVTVCQLSVGQGDSCVAQLGQNSIASCSGVRTSHPPTATSPNRHKSLLFF